MPAARTARQASREPQTSDHLTFLVWDADAGSHWAGFGMLAVHLSWHRGADDITISRREHGKQKNDK